MSTEEVVIDDNSDNELTSNSSKYDDDIVTEILDDNTNNQSDSMIVDTIVLDDDTTTKNIKKKSNKSSEVNKSNAELDKSEKSLANMLRNNTLLTKVVQKCLYINNADGMSRVIHRTLLPIYKETENSFKESSQFTRILKNTLRYLETDPNHKFSHIKSMCDVLVKKKHRKKVPLITLSTDLTKKGYSLRSQVKKFKSNIITKNTKDPCFSCDAVTTSGVKALRPPKDLQNGMEPKTDIIDLDNSDKDELIDLDYYDQGNDVIIVDDCREETEHDARTPTPISDNSNKENDTLLNISPNNSNIISDKELLNNSGDNSLLLPQTHEVVEELSVADRVKQIEQKISEYKKIVATLEEQEALNDTSSSPYVLCDQWKAKIVKLYEELCDITGEEPVKKRLVRLKVNDGYPPGPVRRLQMFLNRNIDSTGAPPFPDFSDVVKCVKRANIEDELGWKNAQVMKEAMALFTQCGQALRKRRQKREWRDLMALVKEERPDSDPADEDPLLSAKLEQNRRVAMAKEHEILEKFTHMQYLPTESTLASQFINIARQEPEHYNNQEIDNILRLPVSENPRRLLTMPLNSSTETSEGSVAESSDNDSEHSDQNYVHSDKTIAECSSNSDKMVVDLPQDINLSSTVPESSSTENCISKPCVSIKPEPVDYQSMLDNLGPDFTVTVFDIEDPFLVIEISSDSSYSDDDGGPIKLSVFTDKTIHEQ